MYICLAKRRSYCYSGKILTWAHPLLHRARRRPLALWHWIAGNEICWFSVRQSFPKCNVSMEVELIFKFAAKARALSVFAKIYRCWFCLVEHEIDYRIKWENTNFHDVVYADRKQCGVFINVQTLPHRMHYTSL